MIRRSGITRCGPDSFSFISYYNNRTWKDQGEDGKKMLLPQPLLRLELHNPRIDRKLTDLHKRLSELDDILCDEKEK